MLNFEIEKAQKNLAQLSKKRIVNKRGVIQTVYVDDKPKQAKSKKTQLSDIIPEKGISATEIEIREDHPIKPLFEELRNAMKEQGVNPKISFMSKSEQSSSGGADAWYDSKTKEIKVDRAAKLIGSDPELLLTHEIIHALTKEKLKKNENFFKHVTKMRAHALKHLGDRPELSYYLSNNDEFVVSVFAEKEFIEALKGVPPYEKSYKNLFHQTYSAFLKAIGLDSGQFLQQAVALSSQIIVGSKKDKVKKLKQEDNMDNEIQKAMNVVDELPNKLKNISALFEKAAPVSYVNKKVLVRRKNGTTFYQTFRVVAGSTADREDRVTNERVEIATNAHHDAVEDLQAHMSNMMKLQPHQITKEHIDALQQKTMEMSRTFNGMKQLHGADPSAVEPNSVDPVKNETDEEIVRDAIEHLQAKWERGMDKDKMESNKRMAKTELSRIVGSSSVSTAISWLQQRERDNKALLNTSTEKPSEAKGVKVETTEHKDTAKKLGVEPEKLGEMINEDHKKEQKNEIKPQKVLNVLRKQIVDYESAYHYNKSTGAESDEMHFRPKNSSKSRFVGNEKEQIQKLLDGAGLQYRFDHADLFVKNKYKSTKSQSELKGDVARKVTPQSILSKLKNSGVGITYEPGHHGNSSVGAKSDELHFKPKYNSKLKPKENELAVALRGYDWRLSDGNDIFVKNTIPINREENNKPAPVSGSNEKKVAGYLEYEHPEGWKIKTGETVGFEHKGVMKSGEVIRVNKYQRFANPYVLLRGYDGKKYEIVISKISKPIPF